jgi:hypothetical protein
MKNKTRMPRGDRSCPLKLDFERALATAKEFQQAIRKLRRSLRRCDNCAQVDDCPIWRNLNKQIDTAIQEITEEWRLGGVE